MTNNLIAATTILAVFPSAEDEVALRTILGPHTPSLQFVRTLQQGRARLGVGDVDILLTDSCPAPGSSWKDFLNENSFLANPATVVVASRLADTQLWAEVLSFGRYDLLAKPFDDDEVVRVLTGAASARLESHRHSMSRREFTRESPMHAEKVAV